MLLTFSAITTVPIESIKFHSFSTKYAYLFVYANATLLRTLIKNWQSRKIGARWLLPPQLFKPCRICRSVNDGVLYVLMSKIVRNQPSSVLPALHSLYSNILAPVVGPPSVDVSVVGCYQNILACGGSSLTSAHQNVGTALSLKKAKPE